MPVLRMLSSRNGTKVKSLGECNLRLENPRTGYVNFENLSLLKMVLLRYWELKQQKIYTLIKTLDHNICTQSLADKKVSNGVSREEILRKYLVCL